MSEHRPSYEQNREAFDDGMDEELLSFAGELEALFSTVPAREERGARANRSAFLTAAAIQFSAPRSAWQGWWRRLLLQGATLLLFFSVSWVSVRVASAGSLPGDALYPIKLTMEQVDLLFYDEQQWEAQVQDRRMAEVIALVESGRVAEVEFQGTLQESRDGSWSIDGVLIDFEPEAEELIQHMCGPVRVQGMVANGEFQLLYLTPSCLSLDTPERPAALPIPTPLIFPSRDGTPSGEPINRYAVF